MSLSDTVVGLADTIDQWIQRITFIFAWAYVLLIVVIITQVFSRYALNLGHPIMEELQWHLYAIGFMFGLAYTQTKNAHVRVDVVAGLMSRKTRLFWEIFGILFLALPFMFVIFYNSLDFVYESWRVNESSDAPIGLPWRWAIKGVIPVTFAILTCSLLTRLARDMVAFFSNQPVSQQEEESSHGV